MKKVVLGVAIIATTLMSADWNTQREVGQYKDRSINTSQSNMNSLSHESVKGGLGYEKPKRGKKPKFKISKVYKKKCSRCHGRRGERTTGTHYEGIREIERRSLEKILFYYAQGRHSDNSRVSPKMIEVLRGLPREQIRALAQYIAEEL